MKTIQNEKSTLEQALNFTRAILFDELAFAVASTRAKDENGAFLATEDQYRKIYGLAQVLEEGRGLEWVKQYFTPIQSRFCSKGVYSISPDKTKFTLSDNARYAVERVEDAAEKISSRVFADLIINWPADKLYVALKNAFSGGVKGLLGFESIKSDRSILGNISYVTYAGIHDAFVMYSCVTSSDDRYMMLKTAAAAESPMGYTEFNEAHKKACEEYGIRAEEGLLKQLLPIFSAKNPSVFERTGRNKYGIAEFGKHIIETVSELERRIVADS